MTHDPSSLFRRDIVLALVEKAIGEGRNPDDVAKPKGTRNPVLLKLWSLLRLGRQAKIFVIIASTQRPDVDFIRGEARNNLVARVAMGSRTARPWTWSSTRMIQQRIHETVTDPDTGQKLITRIRGRATIDIGGGPGLGAGLLDRGPGADHHRRTRPGQRRSRRPSTGKQMVATALAADLAKPVDMVNRRAQPEQGQPTAVARWLSALEWEVKSVSTRVYPQQYR
jgi:hypothetical protein